MSSKQDIRMKWILNDEGIRKMGDGGQVGDSSRPRLSVIG